MLRLRGEEGHPAPRGSRLGGGALQLARLRLARTLRAGEELVVVAEQADQAALRGSSPRWAADRIALGLAEERLVGGGESRPREEQVPARSTTSFTPPCPS